MADWTKQNLDDYFEALRKNDVSRVSGMFASNATLTDENNRILQGNDIKQYYNEFHICPGCDRIYWKGSHYRRMRRFIESIVEREGSMQ